MSIRYLSLYTVIVSIFLLTSTAIAQEGNSTELSAEEMRSLMSSDRIPILSATETTGSPYLFENFNEGSIELVNGRTTNILPVRFNAYEQKLEFQEGDFAFVMDSNVISEFEMYVENSIYKFKKGFSARRLSENEFVRLIIDDKVKFIAKHAVSFHQGVASYGTATQKDEYIPNVTYYIKVGEKGINRIRSLSERRIMRNIDNHKSNIERFAVTNNINFSDAKDVEKLLLYYNTLLKEES